MTFDYKLTELAPGVTIYDYESWLENFDSSKFLIIEIIKIRFENRYIKPISEFDCSGAFTAMAVCCLMIEMFMSHREKEYLDTNGKSKKIFKQFFNDYEPHFDHIDGEEFYLNIRCGIFHQGETRNGWRLQSSGEKLIEEKVISVGKFYENLNKIIIDYFNSLSELDISDEKWQIILDKLNLICENCK